MEEDEFKIGDWEIGLIENTKTHKWRIVKNNSNVIDEVMKVTHGEAKTIQKFLKWLKE